MLAHVKHNAMNAVLCALGTIALFAPAALHAEQIFPAGATSVPGEVLVKLSVGAAFKSGVAPAGRMGIAAVDAELARLAATEVRNAFDLTQDPDGKRALGMDRILHVYYAGSDDPTVAAARLATLAEIEWAEPNFIGHTTFVPTDSLYFAQWAMHNRGQAAAVSGDSVGTVDCDIDMNQAWDVSIGTSDVILAVLDTGIDRNHPEFGLRVMTGYDYVNNDNNPNDDNGHGTACAGIAAAQGHNGRGIAGIAWGVRILPIKVGNSVGQITTANLVSGLTFAADSGADVLSMSLTMDNTMTLSTAITYAYNHDCLMVAATGNLNTNTVGFPAAYDHVIAVGALSPCNERKSPTSCDGENFWGSNYGTELDVMAPGVRIHTTDIRGGPGAPNGSTTGYAAGDYHSTFDGTSAATPHVAGIAALARSMVNWPADAVIAVIQQSCDDLNTPNWDSETGWGRINAYAVLRAVQGGNFVGANPFTETGSYRLPYRTLSAAVNVTQPGKWIVVKPGDYHEAVPLTINKDLQFDAIDGNVIIH